MKTFPIHTLILILAATLYTSGNAQHTVGKWAIGVTATANVWFNDYNKRIVGLGGDFTVRYGVSRRFSVGAQSGFERLKTGQEPLRLEAPHDYLRLDGTPLTLLSWYHFMPGKPVAPYVFAGIGLLRYTRQTGLGTYTPDADKRTSVCVPLGVGIETCMQQGLSLDFTVGYVILNNATDGWRKGMPDGYANARFGINLYLGSSDDEDVDGDGLTNAQEEEARTNRTNPDTDEDGLSDGAEVHKYHTDPLNADSDFDKLKDGDEVFKYHTDPLKADTDFDGFTDGEEVLRETDPLDPKSHP